jgi:hypothetical protein
MTTEDELRPLALRVWPNAKRIRISHHSGSITAEAFDVHNRIIGQMSAASADALREALDHSLPPGGQAP